MGLWEFLKCYGLTRNLDEYPAGWLLYKGDWGIRLQENPQLYYSLWL